MPHDMKQYSRNYYREHKEAISQKRRLRYQSDPEFRTLVRVRALERVRRLRAEARKARAANFLELGVRGFNKPRVVVVGDKRVVIYSIGEFAKRVKRRPQTLHLWEKLGVIPAPSFTDLLNRKWYTTEFMDAVAQAVRQYTTAGERSVSRLAKMIAEVLKGAEVKHFHDGKGVDE